MAQSEVIRELLVALGVKADTKGVKSFGSAVADAKKQMLGLVAVGVGFVASQFAIAKSTATAGDQAAKTGKQIGTSAEFVQEATHAADQSGASFKEFATGMRRMGASAFDASKGLSSPKEAFDDLGVSVRDSVGELKDQEALFLDVADAISQNVNETENLALASRIFGRAGGKLLPLLKEGRAGFEAYRKEAHALGFVMSEDATKSAERFVDALDEVKKIVIGLKRTIGVALLPVFTELFTAFRDWFILNRALIQQRVEKTGERIAKSFKKILPIMQKLDRAVQSLFGGWGNALALGAGAFVAFKIVGLLLGVAGAVGGMVTAFSAASLAATASGTTIAAVAASMATGIGEVVLIVAAVIAVLVAFGLVVEDLYVWLKGGESAIGLFFESFGEGEGALDQFANLLRDLKDLALELWPVLKGIGLVVKDKLVAAFDSLREAVQPALDKLKELWDLVSSGVGADLLAMLGDARGFVASAISGVQNEQSFDKFRKRAAGTTVVPKGATSTSTTTNQLGGNTFNVSGVADAPGTLAQIERQQRLQAMQLATAGAER